MNDVVVGIPTFRRPALLRQLLETLMPQMGEGNLVVVADNDCSAEARAVVEDFGGRSAGIAYVEVPERGLSAVRNALVAAAAREMPEWRWLAMLDDDGLATPGWLNQIVACGERMDADLVGGPVLGVLPDDANRLARNSIYAQRRRWPTGLVPSLNTTQNLLIARRLTERVGLPLFRSDYGASGGEDYDLFRRSAKSGARIAWCDEAVIREPAPADRLTVPSVIGRYYSTGIYMSRIDQSYDGRLQGWRVALGGIAVSVLGALPLVAASLQLVVWPTWADAAAAALHGLTGLAGAAAFLAGVAWFVAVRETGGPVTGALVAVGRRSLTCYLLQSLVMVPVLAPWGLGLGDGSGTAVVSLVAVGSYLLGVALCVALERAGRPGPAEVLLRRLTYGPRSQTGAVAGAPR